MVKRSLEIRFLHQDLQYPGDAGVEGGGEAGGGQEDRPQGPRLHAHPRAGDHLTYFLLYFSDRFMYTFHI